MTPLPKNGERIFDKEYAKTLIDISKEDMESAKGLRQADKGRKETVVYLIQQAIEKAIKAVLCHSETAVPLVHDLGALIAKLPADINVPHGYDLLRFNDYAGILRYERGHSKLSKEDLDAAIAAGTEVVAWATAIIT